MHMRVLQEAEFLKNFGPAHVIRHARPEPFEQLLKEDAHLQTRKVAAIESAAQALRPPSGSVGYIHLLLLAYHPGTG
jgi:hypothetical protein